MTEKTKKKERTEEEKILDRAKRRDWYYSRSEEYKQDLLRKQREYSARKRKEAQERGVRIRRQCIQTDEQRALHNMQSKISKQNRIAKNQKELEEQGLYDYRVCTCCGKKKPLSAFRSKKLGYGRMCEVCRLRIYASSKKGLDQFTPALWRQKAYGANTSTVVTLRRKGGDAAIQSLAHIITGEDVARMFEEQKGLCAYCGCVLDTHFHLDHKVPRSLGGLNTPENVHATCPECNRIKHNKSHDDFVKFIVAYASNVLKHQSRG